MLGVSVWACWLDVCAMGYATEYLTDGFVPEAIVKGLDPRLKTPYILAAQLVEAGRWHVVPGGYQIHDFLVYNPSAAEVRAELESKVAAGKIGGQRSVTVREAKYGTRGVVRAKPDEPSHEAGASGKVNQDVKQVLREPSRSRNEAPSLSDSDSVPVGRKLRGVRPPVVPHGGTSAFMDFWIAYPRKVAKEAALRAWQKLAPENGMVEQIMAAVAAHAAQPGWQERPQFIPHPATWLNGKRWQDELAPTTPDRRRINTKWADVPSGEVRL